MCQDNQTKVTEIQLLGFQGLENFKPLFFTVLLLLYIAIVTGNLLIILLVLTSDNLKIPMFIFLQHLAIADLLLATCVIPMMTETILRSKGKMSVVGCLMQLYFYINVGFVQCFILAVMSYDRYVAICNPLHYILIMDHRICSLLGYGCWIITLGLNSIEFILIAQFQFCGSSDIDYFFCDVGPVVELSTSDTSIVQWLDFTYSVLFFLCAFMLILGSYIYIFIIIFKISSSAGRKKSFSTCSAHLTSVGAYYGSLVIIYVTPANEMSPYLNKYSSLLYIVVNPLVNPIIYSLRNYEIRQALNKKVRRIFKVGGNMNNDGQGYC
ncbi:olfactory receptor 10C1-like [Mantella aurantiaca]